MDFVGSSHILLLALQMANSILQSSDFFIVGLPLAQRAEHELPIVLNLEWSDQRLLSVLTRGGSRGA